MEYFELLNEDGTKTGKVKERELVHKDGDLHGGSHVWVVKKKDKGSIKKTGYEVLLQKRRLDKDSFPGCFDISCAGHVDEGETFLSTAIRELKEELNLMAEEQELQFLFSQKVEGKYDFHGKPFWNREVNYVYILDPKVSLDSLSYQKEEIEALCWIELEELVQAVRSEQEDFCIWKEEMEKVYEYLCRYGIE